MARDMRKFQHYYDNDKIFAWTRYFELTTKLLPNGNQKLNQYVIDCEYDLMNSFCYDEMKFVEFVKTHGEYLTLVIPVTRMKVKVLHNCFITKDTISGKNVLCGIHGMNASAPFKYVLVEDLVSPLKIMNSRNEYVVLHTLPTIDNYFKKQIIQDCFGLKDSSGDNGMEFLSNYPRFFIVQPSYAHLMFGIEKVNEIYKVIHEHMVMGISFKYMKSLEITSCHTLWCVWNGFTATVDVKDFHPICASGLREMDIIKAKLYRFVLDDSNRV